MQQKVSTLEYPQTNSPGKTSADTVFSKISWRLVPLLLISYVVAYLDRVNIGYAQLQMKQTLPWDATVYSLGAGIFFIGYVLCEVPSNLMLERIGARKTLLRIMGLWGIVASAIMFVTTPTQFYILRFVLGACEAGFFPGLILYLTFWYPSARRGQMIAIMISATAIGGIVAGPLSGAVLKYMDGINGWHGWQWLYLTQGLPAVILGIIIYLVLDDKPDDAKWLTPSEKTLVRFHLAHDDKDIEGEESGSLGDMFRDFKVYLLALVYFLVLGANYIIVFWMPTLIQSWGVADMFKVGIYSSIPYACGTIGMILFGRSSDKRHERRWHFFASVTTAALALFVLTLLKGSLVVSIIALSAVFVGFASAAPLLFTIVSEYMSPAAAAGGIALVSSLGNLSSSVSPYVNTVLYQSTGETRFSLYLVALLYFLSGLLLLATVRAAKPHDAG